MKTIEKISGKEEKYIYLLNNLETFFDKNDHILSNLSNFAAVYYDTFENLNWAGFYFDNGKKLVLGPFQGKIACTNIDYNRGVCGKAFSTDQVVVVKDVHQFEGHIACDAASQSEIVVPFYKNNQKIGVFDVDSPKLENFCDVDAHYLKLIIDKFFDKIINYEDLIKICKLI
jgi:L-methionine (R)-S-oxide reductase